jgi:hypothetical protein
LVVYPLPALNCLNQDLQDSQDFQDYFCGFHPVNPKILEILIQTKKAPWRIDALGLFLSLK